MVPLTWIGWPFIVAPPPSRAAKVSHEVGSAKSRDYSAAEALVEDMCQRGSLNEAALLELARSAQYEATVAALVKIDSRGPVLFRQDRVGRGGRFFKIFKFRTMVADAEGHRDELLERSIYPDRRLFKILRDPRVTRLGAWLRRTSLDELPQLINVLRGEMSLVGPRPPLPSEVALYGEHHYARFDVKPGITGPWQVAGRNQVTDFEQIVALETHYIREWSLLMDLGVLLRTIVVVFTMRGAV